MEKKYSERVQLTKGCCQDRQFSGRISAFQVWKIHKSESFFVPGDHGLWCPLSQLSTIFSTYSQDSFSLKSDI